MYSFLSSPITSYKNLPQQMNIIDYSVLGELSCKVPFNRFSIKYVISGEETYIINGKRYDLHSGSYLMANQFAEGSVYIEGNSVVTGLCIDLAPNLISEAVASFIRPDTFYPDADLNQFFNSESFLENQYQAKNTMVGKDLFSLSEMFAKDPALPRKIPHDIFYGIAEHIVQDHIPVYKQLQEISVIKQHTRKELYRRLQIARNYMEENFIHPPSIAIIAKQCNLSEFHFFRLFKKVYRVTPYQFMLNKRMTFAAELLKDPTLTITEIAVITGFSDLYAFSKIFKKYYKLPPSRFISK